mmetsp:Transcript_40608/g.52303  ORF Transcript_40608/g.52303 Transcript_40608/m.52303 type:complete len:148 (+) Transcript_40608:22-465(+)
MANTAEKAAFDRENGLEKVHQKKNILEPESTQKYKKIRFDKLQKRIIHLESEIEQLTAKSEERTEILKSTVATTQINVQEKLLSSSSSSSSQVVSKPISISMQELQDRAGQISVRLATQDLLLNKLKRENYILSTQILTYTSTPSYN